MTSANAVIVCLAYILGLLATGLGGTSFLGGTGGGFLVLAAAVGASVWVPRRWRTGPRSRLWLIAGLVGLLASCYFQWRVPQPRSNDVSRLITAEYGQVTATLQGQVDTLPRLTRNGGEQFWLTVDHVDELGGPKAKLDLTPGVTGRLYVTAAKAEADKLQPGQRIRLAGTLSLPKPATNPGGFDFRAFLQREGCFAALRSDRIDLLDAKVQPGLWQVQQQIVRSQAQWTSPAEGALISAMVLGSRAVDLPFDVKDEFVRVGLAHALAASGFQTSLILGVVLSLCCRFSERVQFAIGTSALLLFVGLTGVQPAVLRAALMGFGGLVALVLGRKIRPLGSLLVTATLLLGFNPLWIWDLGFQLSFLATLGLLVSVPHIAYRLDWVPSAIAPLIAVPIAAYLWTLPLQLYAFGIVSPYSIPANLITTPFISLLSLGGMISALGALIWSPLGSGSAWLLKFPAQGLILIVDGFGQLPGSVWAIGTISALMAIALYSLVGLAWLQAWWQKRWWMALAIGIGLVSIPAWQMRLAQFQVTILATAGQPALVVQDAGRTGLIQTNDTAINTVLPFLQKAGVNRLDWALPLQSNGVALSKKFKSKKADINTWQTLSERLPIRMAYALPNGPRDAWQNAKARPQNQAQIQPNQPTQMGSTQMKLLHRDPAIVEFQMQDKTWLWLETASLEEQEKWVKSVRFSPVAVLWWSGQSLHPEVIKALKPEVAIASAPTVNPETAAQLRRMGSQLYWTGRDGALQWNPQTGFKATLNAGEIAASSL